MRSIVFSILLSTLVLSGCATESLKAGDKVTIAPGQVLMFGELKVTDNHHKFGGVQLIGMLRVSGSLRFISTNPDGTFYGAVPAGEYALRNFYYPGYLGAKLMEPGKAYYVGKIVIDLSRSFKGIPSVLDIDYMNSLEVRDDLKSQLPELLSIAPSLRPEDVIKSLVADNPDIATKLCPNYWLIMAPQTCFSRDEALHGKLAIASEQFGAERVAGTKTSDKAAKEGAVTGALGGAVAGTAVGVGVAGATIASAGIYAPVPALWPFAIAGAAVGAAAGGSAGAEKGISKEDLVMIQKAYDHAMDRAKQLESVSLRVERKAKQAGRDVRYVEGLSTNQFGVDNAVQLLRDSASDALLNLSIKAIGMKVRQDRLPQMPLEIQLQSEVVLPDYERKKSTLYFLSHAHTIQEWSADDGKLLIEAIEEGFEKLSDKAMRQYFWLHRETP